MTEISDATAQTGGTLQSSSRPAVTVAICTFRRPAIVAALASLAALTLRDIGLRIIVVDNDDQDSARLKVQGAAGQHHLDLCYLHVAGSNISIARNACLEACTTDCIDDDETATPGWLQALVDAMRQTLGIAAAFGLMQAIYVDGTPDWLRRGDFHSTRIVHVDGEIRTGYTTNTLIDLRHPAVRGKRFDPALGKSGGEDTDFFDRVYRDGGRFIDVPSAVVDEILTPDRQSLRWFLRRRFRSGQTHGRLLARYHRGPRRVFQAGLAAIKALCCLAMMVVKIGDEVAWRRWLLRGALHCGVVARLCGKQEQALYGEAPKTARLNA